MIIEMTEARLQAEAVAWFRRRYNRLGPLMFMIKNDGRKSARAGALDTALGLTPGTPDVMLAVPSKGKSGLFLEFKTKTGKLSAAQVLQLDRLNAQGYEVAVVRSLEIFKDIIKNYLEIC